MTDRSATSDAILMRQHAGSSLCSLPESPRSDGSLRAAGAGKPTRWRLPSEYLAFTFLNLCMAGGLLWLFEVGFNRVLKTIVAGF